MSDDRWFEVTAKTKIRAASEDEAIDRVADVLRGRMEHVPRLFPVATFNAAPCADPTVRPSERERRID